MTVKCAALGVGPVWPFQGSSCTVIRKTGPSNSDVLLYGLHVSTNEPRTVLSPRQARRKLKGMLKEFRQNDLRSDPVFVGRGEEPEAVVVAYESWRILLDYLELGGVATDAQPRRSSQLKPLSEVDGISRHLTEQETN